MEARYRRGALRKFSTGKSFSRHGGWTLEAPSRRVEALLRNPVHSFPHHLTFVLFQSSQLCRCSLGTPPSQQIQPRHPQRTWAWKPRAFCHILQRRLRFPFRPSWLLSLVWWNFSNWIIRGMIYLSSQWLRNYTLNWAGFKGTLSLASLKAIAVMHFCSPLLLSSGSKPGPVRAGAGPAMSWHDPSRRLRARLPFHHCVCIISFI